jgi:NAD(P)-dependent dehydrogenase (short-subunit alcohol dehydrogenase family)
MALADIANSRILIIGGSSGMGMALAKHSLAAGAEVIIAGRNEDKLQRASAELRNPALSTVAVDITQEAQVVDLFERSGQLDHIVSTAADIEGAYELLPSLDLKAAQRVVESKFYGPLLLAKHGAPKLSPKGSITFTSGIAAYRPSARGSVVAAVNAALEGLVRALAVELAPIRVNAVSPGWVDTPIWAFRGRRQEGRDVGRHGKAATGRARWATGGYRRRYRLSDGQRLYDGDDIACRGRTSADLARAK